jgi:tRNA-dihydrouridine synthase
VEACGADFITVHPRRRCDLYSGVADWRIIGEIKRAISIPVVGNGDVWYASDALRLRRETGCDAVMIGRPALRNPFIFRQIEQLARGEVPDAPDGPALLATLEEIIGRYRDYYGAQGRNATGPIKELLRWIGRSVNDGRKYQSEVLKQSSIDDILRVSRRHLERLLSADLDIDAHGGLGLEQSGSALTRLEAQSTRDDAGTPLRSPSFSTMSAFT